jgi:hypothetical protein
MTVVSRTLQDQHQVIELKIQGHRAAIIEGGGFRAGVAYQGYDDVVVDLAGDELALGFGLRGIRGAEGESCQSQSKTS